MKKIYLQILSVLLLCPFMAAGQQQALYTQYMFNGLAINPAYAGTSEALSITALGRWQWIGMDGAPRTQTITAHTPIEDTNVGLGLTFINDQIGVTRQTGVYGVYAYRLPIRSGFLSFGLQGGFTNLKNNFNEARTITPDPALQVQSSQFLPNVGAGVFYYNAVFYAGLSAPLLLENKNKNASDDGLVQKRHYFFTTGMVFDLSENIKIKPNILLKAIAGSPFSADYNVNLLFSDNVWFGVSYRTSGSVNFLTEVNITNKFTVGYAYDHIVEKAFRNAASSSHEIMMNYRISLTKRGVLSPRLF